MKNHLLSYVGVAVLLLLPTFAGSQTIIFHEGFEAATLPTGWSQRYIIEKGDGAGVDWLFQKGGRQNTYPDSAAVGSRNATFLYESYNNETTQLTTPPIDLSNYKGQGVVLTFWHIQQLWSGFNDNDELRVYYSRQSDTSRLLIATYTTNVEQWTLRTIQLPDSILDKNFQVSFEGKTKYGDGVCIDEVTLKTTTITPRTLSGLKVSQASTSLVASGTQDNPLLRIDFTVSGNSGTVPLQSIAVRSLCSNDTIIPAAGVKLYFTTDTFFSTNNLLGTAQSFSSGLATFSGLNQNLPFGLSSVWVALDVTSTAPQGSYIDAYIKKNEIQVNGTTYPSADASPAGQRNLISKIYFTGFETNPAWTFVGDFQRGAPQGKGGYLPGKPFTGGSPDPTSAYLGTNVIGDDLTGTNSEAPGNYKEYVTADNPNVAVTPSFNLLYYKDVTLSFYRWLNVYWEDWAGIDVSNDGGVTWNDIWDNSQEGGIVADAAWKLKEITDDTHLFERNQNVIFRFRLGPTTYTRLSSGWNIDNVLLTGNYITTDVGISSWSAPNDGCGLSSTEPVKVMIKNFGSQAITKSFQVSYQLVKGGPVVSETVSSSIAAGDSLLYGFSQTADFSSPKVYSNISVWTSLSGDQDASNDTLHHVLYSLPYSHIASNSYYDNFEQTISLWKTYGNENNSFACGTPNGPLLKTAASPVKCWKTFLTNYYYDNDSSFVESPCFDFTGVEKAIFEFKLWTATEPEHDGAVLQYSLNGGTSWQIVPNHPYPWKWNWYGSHIISALGTVGWDSLSNGWVTAKQVLPAVISGKSNVKFRFHFQSDASNNDEGFAFDDVKVYVAPKDVGVSSFTSLTTSCQYTNSNYVSLYVRNYGLNKLNTGDTLIVGLNVNANSPIKDTFILAAPVNVLDSVKVTFKKPTNLNAAGTYNITAYTLIEPTPRFYGTKNDTASTTITVLPDPVTTMIAAMNSARPDTIVLKPHYDSNYSYYWYYDSSTGSTLHIPSAGKYKVRVTNTGGNGCIAYDSTLVGLLTPDIGLDSVLMPATACSGTASEQLKVRFRNFGTDTLEVKDTVYVAFRFNGGAAVLDTVKLTQRLFPNGSLLHTTAKNPMDLHALGTYSLKAWSGYRWDKDHSNDTLNNTIHIWGFPTVNIGPDTTVSGLTYLLDAGPGFKTYTWDDGSHGETYLARYLGNHWVTVTDIHDCPASDTAFIHLVIHDLSVTQVTAPVSGCSISGLTNVKIAVTNSGTDTIITGTNVEVGYKKYPAAWVTENFNLGSPLYPGVSVNHTFAPQENFTSTGSHLLDAYVHLIGDIQTANDTLRDTVNVWGYPPVNLGQDTLGVPALQFQLDAGYGDHYTYLWRDGSKNETYTVTSNGFYYVAVTDTLHNCVARDTIYVSLDINDVGITQLISDTVFCSNDLTGLTVRIKNFGNNQYPVGKKIPVGYTLNGGSEVLDTLVLQAIMPSNTASNFTTRKFPLKPSGVSPMVIYTKLKGDLRSSNDTLRFNLTIKPSPTVNLGGTNDSIKYVDLPVTLDAGPGFVSYLWNDGSSSQTFTVNGPGWCSVIVSDGTGCTGKDSVYLSKVTAVTNVISMKGLKVYPNPASGYITIQYDAQAASDLVLEVINPQGEVVIARKIKGQQSYLDHLDVSGLARGMYYLRIYNSSFTQGQKLVLQ